jgi:carbon monoxide dehydrogenase subunit G
MTPRQIATGLCALAFALGIAACGETASTSNFKGEGRNVAQTVANFQTDVTASDQKKLCKSDLAGTLTARFKDSGGCEAAVETAVHGIDSLNLTIEAITVKGKTAIAKVKSTYSGKSRITTLTLVEEGTHWKISGVQS